MDRGFMRQDQGGCLETAVGLVQPQFHIPLFHSRAVSLLPAQDKESIQRVLQAVDKANGYCFGVQEQRSLEAVMSAAVGADFHFSSYPCSLASATAKSGRPGAQEWPCLPLQTTDFMLTSGLPGNWSLGRLQGCLFLRTREAVDQKEQQIQRPRYERALVT